MIRDITIPIRADGLAPNLLAHAAVLAHRFHAHILALHCRPRPEDLLPFGVPIGGFLRDTVLGSVAGIADAEEAKLRAEFDALAQRLGLEASAEPVAGRATVAWREEAGRQVDVIKTHGRLADLVVVSKPDRDRNLGANTLKAALFHTGRPVLMCPGRTEPPKRLGERITIGWDGSAWAARAVTLSMGLLAAAAEVTVLTSGIEVHGATAPDLVRHLARRGVRAVIQPFEARGRVGERLLEASDALGADMLVMGAYSRSHEHETIFGGTTQHVVDAADMCIVLVH